MDQLHTRLGDAGDAASTQRLAAANRTYVARQDALLALLRDGKTGGGHAYLGASLLPALRDIELAFAALVAAQHEQAQAIAAHAYSLDQALRFWMTVLLVSLAASAGIGLWIARSITRPVADALRFASTVAAGDLTGQLAVRSRNEMGHLLALQAMSDKLARTVAVVRSGAHAIDRAAGEVAAGNLDLFTRTEQQAGALEETASSMEQLTATVRGNADSAHEASKCALAASTVAEQGGRAIAKVAGTMEQISAFSKKISEITGVRVKYEF